jgi:hypothetical protein
MSEQSQQSEADGMASSGTPAESFSSNGSYPEGAVGIAEPAEMADSAVAAEEAAPPEMTAEATDAVGDELTADGAESAPGEPAPDDGTAFLAELARAMQATAGVERKRLEEDTERRREAHLEAIRVRKESEATTMRDLAAEDLKAIDEWAEAERQRIDKEREGRAAALQEDLDTSLTEHGSKIDREIEAVDAAIVAYRTEVDAYFAALDQETDPVEIARHAGQRPTFPDLDAVSAAETVTPETEVAQVAVGVMAPATPADLADAWSQWNQQATAPSGVAESPVAPDGATSEGEVSSTEGAATSSLLQTVKANRPFANLRGDRSKD